MGAVPRFVLLILLLTAAARAQEPQLMPLGPAWAANSINTGIYRNDSVTSHGDRQYAAYYNADGKVVIATRTIGAKSTVAGGYERS